MLWADALTFLIIDISYTSQDPKKIHNGTSILILFILSAVALILRIEYIINTKIIAPIRADAGKEFIPDKKRLTDER